jgi:hypothetical protein
MPWARVSYSSLNDVADAYEMQSTRKHWSRSFLLDETEVHAKLFAGGLAGLTRQLPGCACHLPSTESKFASMLYYLAFVIASVL